MAQTDAETPVSSPAVSPPPTPEAPPVPVLDKAPEEVGIRDLLAAGVHFGHQTKRWNPKMKRYIFDKRNGIHVIDLAKSLTKLKEALNFVRDTVLAGKPILFVGTKKQAQQAIGDTAQSCGLPYVNSRWLGGAMTNSSTIRKSVKRYKELTALEAQDDFDSFPKKEASRMRRELAKLRYNLSGIADMTTLPGALFIVDINREAIAVKEARKLNIPIVAMLDTNCDPDLIDYVIPANDDAIRAVELILALTGHVIRQAQEEQAKIAAELARKKEAEAQKEAEAKQAAREAKRAEQEKKQAEKAAAAASAPGSAPAAATVADKPAKPRKPAGARKKETADSATAATAPSAEPATVAAEPSAPPTPDAEEKPAS